MTENRSKNRIGRFFASTTDRVYRAIRKGPVGRFFSAYSVSNGLYNGMLLRPVRRRKQGSPLRRGLAKAMDRSLLRGLAHSILNRICRCSLRTVGLFLFTTGAYSAVINWLIASVWQDSAPDALGLFVGLALILVGFLLFFSGTSVGYAVGRSATLGVVLREVLGLSEDVFADMPQQGKQGYVLTVPLGMAVGTLSALIGPLYLLVAVLLLLLALVVFTTPEAGVLLLIFVVPFIGLLPYSELLLAVGVLLSLCGYACKLLRGTRAFHMEIQDAVVLALLVSVLLGGFSASDGAFSRSVTAAVLIALYFSAVNTLTTPQWLQRCRRTLLGSATVAAMYAIVQFVVALAEAIQSPREVNMAEIGRAVRAGFLDHSTFAYFMVLVFPFAMYAFARMRAHHRLPAGLACVSIVVATALTWVQSAWIAMAVELIVMCLVCAKRFVPYMLMLLSLLPVVVVLLPATLRERIARVLFEGSDLASSRTGVAGEFAAQVFFERGSGFFGRGAGLLRLLFGLGDGGIEAVCVLYTELDSAALVVSFNFWLYRLMEGGVLGVILPALLFFLLLQNCFSILHRMSNTKEYVLPVAGVVTVCGVLVSSIFRYAWYDPAALLAFFAVTSLITADARYHRSQEMPVNEMDSSTSFAEFEYQIKGSARSAAPQEEVKDEP